MTARPWQAPRRGGMLLLVLLAHGLLLVLLTLALQRGSRFAAASPAAPAMNLLWLRQPIVLPPPAAADQELPPKLPSRPMHSLPRAQQPAPHRPAVEPQAISITPMPSDETATPAVPAPPQPLDLRLPSQRASQPLPAAVLTRDDPRVRDRLSYGERMARDLGTDNSLHEEALPDGSRRFSRGTGCVVARPSRMSELDPFNNSSSPRPRSIGPC